MTFLIEMVELVGGRLMGGAKAFSKGGSAQDFEGSKSWVVIPITGRV